MPGSVVSQGDLGKTLTDSAGRHCLPVRSEGRPVGHRTTLLRSLRACSDLRWTQEARGTQKERRWPPPESATHAPCPSSLFGSPVTSRAKLQ